MFLESGFQDFMPKPIELSTLDKMLKTWLSGELLKKAAVAESPAEPSSPRHAALLETDDTLAGLIDTKLGMFYTGGQADAYLNILSTYLNKGAGKIEKIRSLYEKREWKNYVIEVHALKSSSLSVGAKQLSELAKELEAAGKEGNIKLIEEKNAGLLDLYREVVEAGKQYLESCAAAPSSESSSDAAPSETDTAVNILPEIDSAGLAEIIKRIQDAGDAFDSEAMSAACEETCKTAFSILQQLEQ